MPGGTNIRISDTRTRQMLRGRTGPVMTDLDRRGKRVLRRARQLAPGKMKNQLSVNTQSGHVRVESRHPATLYVIKGTKRHSIRKGKVWRGRKMLRFVKGGRVVFARWVKHPGTKANNFLAKALRETR